MRSFFALLGFCTAFALGVALSTNAPALAQENAPLSEVADAPSTEAQQPPAAQAEESPLGAAYELWAQSRDKPSTGTDLTLRDDFDGELSLPWNIVRVDLDHLSLKAHEGHLTVTTQRGNIHGVQESYPAKNVFLIENPLGTGDFSMTMKVSNFSPKSPFQQIALLCYDDDDNYLKWSYEYSWRPGKGKNFVLVRETNVATEHDLSYVEDLEDFWLRVSKRGDSYECAFSADGKDFEIVGQRPWGNGSPRCLGLVAKNGGNEEAGEIEAEIDWFEVKGYDSVAASAPATELDPPSDSSDEVMVESPVAEPSTKVPATYQVDFRNGAFDHDVLIPVGHRSVYGLTMFHRDSKGLRIELPADQGQFKPFVGVAPALRVCGDFEITASYDLLSGDRPKEGEGAGANLYIMTHKSGNGAMLRRCTAPDGSQVFMVYELIVHPEWKGPRSVRYFPAKSSVGKLRLARTGRMLEYRVADGSDSTFRTLHTVEFGDHDVSMLRMEAATGGARARVRVRWQDLTIHADELTPVKIPLLE